MEITLRIIVGNKTIVNVKVKGVNALVNVIHICDIMYSYLSAGTRGGIEMTNELIPIAKPQYFEKKHKGKYMILVGTDTEYPCPYRDLFTNKQLADTLVNVQKIAFMIMSQDDFDSYKGIQIICEESK